MTFARNKATVLDKNIATPPRSPTSPTFCQVQCNHFLLLCSMVYFTDIAPTNGPVEIRLSVQPYGGYTFV